MSYFYIYLSNYGRTYRLDKSQFISRFPESMITQALNDPEVETINLSNQSIIPRIMNLINYIVSRGYIPSLNNPMYPSLWRDSITSSY